MKFDNRLAGTPLAMLAVCAALLGFANADATELTCSGCTGANEADDGSNGTSVSNTAIGSNATATGSSSTAVGTNSFGTMEGGTALGNNAGAAGLLSTSLGLSSRAFSSNSIALGFNARGVTDSISIGNNSTTQEPGFVIAGTAKTAIGTSAEARADFSVALGAQALALSPQSTAIGQGSKASGERSTALGRNARATALRSTAIGQGAAAANNDSIAVGKSATVEAISGIAVGLNAEVEAAGGAVLGTKAKVRPAGTSSVALGENSIANAPNTVSVGRISQQRRIVQVADGINEFDAVNVGQLDAMLMVKNQQQQESLNAAFAAIEKLEQRLAERDEILAALQNEVTELRNGQPQMLASAQ